MQLCHHHLHPEIKKKIVNVGSVKLSNFFSIFSFYFFFLTGNLSLMLDVFGSRAV